MAKNQPRNPNHAGAAGVGQPAAGLLKWAALLILAEAAAVALFALFLLWGLVTGQAKLPAGELLLVVLFGAAAAWLVYMSISLRKGARWARSGAIFWQTCQLFIASQSFTGRGANWLIGGFLVATALAVGVLLFNRAVLAESKRQIDEGR